MSAAATARVLVLEHIACEPPAAFGEELAARGIASQTLRPHAGDRMPEPGEHAAIIAMGGPMGAYEERELPWLAAEKNLLARAARADVPVWGVCLGAQLLAAALGASVAAGAAPEIGVLEVALTPPASDDPVFALAPARFPALQWHGDTYTLPEGAVHLARSERYEQQAFAYRRAYALQFHLEVTAEMVAEWARVPAYSSGLQQLDGHAEPGDSLQALLRDLRAAEVQARALARGLFASWLTNVARLPG